MFSLKFRNKNVWHLVSTWLNKTEKLKYLFRMTIYWIFFFVFFFFLVTFFFISFPKKFLVQVSAIVDLNIDSFTNF